MKVIGNWIVFQIRIESTYFEFLIKIKDMDKLLRRHADNNRIVFAQKVNLSPILERLEDRNRKSIKSQN